ncbi:16255_t:CDS:2 [Gigaspora margarita]|uniref:16255_t:CDS:1 n=1 Tax=Gigaspora margarita TaxID=4874 RepID=A0ABN7VM77_GIGMA|nr:16255_t:CDS:2 [Gigaspora margarita]
MSTSKTGDKPDKKRAKEWEKTRSCTRVHINRRTLSGATINGTINNINGSISGGVFDVKSTPKRTNQEKDDDKVQKRTRIDDYFQRTPEHQKAIEQNSMNHYSIPDHEGVIMENVDNEDTYTKNIQLSHENMTEEVRSIIEKIQRIECPLFKYRVVNLSVRDVSNPINKLTESEKNLLKKIWNSQTELSYHEDFVNSIIAKVFDNIMDLIRVKTGEIENKLSKNQRNETRQYKQRIQIGCYQDGIYTVNINAIIFEIGFLEVVRSAIYVNITKLNEDTEKVFKCMQISIFYQRQHHLQRGVK